MGRTVDQAGRSGPAGDLAGRRGLGRRKGDRGGGGDDLELGGGHPRLLSVDLEQDRLVGFYPDASGAEVLHRRMTQVSAAIARREEPQEELDSAYPAQDEAIEDAVVDHRRGGKPHAPADKTAVGHEDSVNEFARWRPIIDPVGERAGSMVENRPDCRDEVSDEATKPLRSGAERRDRLPADSQIPAIRKVPHPGLSIESGVAHPNQINDAGSSIRPQCPIRRITAEAEGTSQVAAAPGRDKPEPTARRDRFLAVKEAVDDLICRPVAPDRDDRLET